MSIDSILKMGVLCSLNFHLRFKAELNALYAGALVKIVVILSYTQLNLISEQNLIC